MTISLNTVSELIREVYLPALQRSAREHDLYMEREYGMRNPMPYFDWWPGLTTLLAAPADVKSRLRRAWRELRTGMDPYDTP